MRSPQPQRGALLHRWLRATDPAFRKVLLEVYARRYYRIRELRNLRFDEHDGQLLCAADYDWENKHIHLVVAYSRARRGCRMWRTAVAAHLDARPEDRQVVVDLTTWRAGPHTPVDETAPDVERASRRVRLRLRAVAASTSP